MDNIKVAKLQAQLMSDARYKTGKSQEFMAMSLGISKNTVYNWEKGTSSPDIKQFIQWFEILGFNPTPFVLQFTSPDLMKDLSHQTPDDRIEDALIHLVTTMPSEMQRGLFYIFYGSHGSDPYSVMQMTLAYLHCDLKSRVPLASAVRDNYDICAGRGELVDQNNILPKMDVFNEAIRLGKEAVISRKTAYSNKRID